MSFRQISFSGLLAVLAAALVPCGCLHDPEPHPETGPFVDKFVNMWETYEGDSGYPLFAYKEIDWMAVAEVYYPLANEAETLEEVVYVMFDMLTLLEDPSIVVITPEGDTLETCPVELDFNVDMDVLVNNYLEPNGFLGESLGVGLCDPAVLPYAYFRVLPASDDTTGAKERFDGFLAQCVDLQVPQVFLDIRMNPTGTRAGSDLICWFDNILLTRFLEHSHKGAVYRLRAGLEYDMYYDLHPAYDPAGPYRYTGPVYVLAGGGCTQGAEDMVANMEYFPDVVTVGETTAGISTCTREVRIYIDDTNYWAVSFGYATLLTHAYQWVEGVGVEPDVHIESTPGDFAAGVDPVMEYVLETAGVSGE